VVTSQIAYGLGGVGGIEALSFTWAGADLVELQREALKKMRDEASAAVVAAGARL
jgi:hypothetical protein